MKHVVAWDPEGIFWEGAVVEDLDVGRIRARGGVTLPCAPETFTLAGFSGYARRSWGSGWPLEGNTPKLISPIAIFAPGDPHRRLHWAARLVPAAEVAPEMRTGVLRLAATEAYWNQHRAVVSEGNAQRNLVQVSEIGKPDERGGWTVGGSCFLHVQGPGNYGLGIYGFAPGMRLAWLAVTLTP
jgi:hypothetical protein